MALLRVEHLNRIVKNAIRFLGANKTEKSITRVGRAIGTLAPVLDDDNTVIVSSGRQKQPNAQKDIEVVVNKLIKADCLVNKGTKGRHSQFPKPRNTKGRKKLINCLAGKVPGSI